MHLMLAAIRAKFLELQTLGRSSFVFCLAVVAVLALAALKLNNFPGHVTFS